MKKILLKESADYLSGEDLKRMLDLKCFDGKEWLYVNQDNAFQFDAAEKPVIVGKSKKTQTIKKILKKYKIRKI